MFELKIIWYFGKSHIYSNLLKLNYDGLPLGDVRCTIPSDRLIDLKKKWKEQLLNQISNFQIKATVSSVCMVISASLSLVSLVQT